MSTQLALPGSVTETALELPPGLSFEDWHQTGETLGRIGRACQWWIGDWINYGERSYGETYAQALDETGYEYDTLNAFRWVADRIESVRRLTSLSWSHHHQVAALETSEQDYWLGQAEAEKWSVHELRRRIRRPRLLEPPALPEGEYAVLYADPPWQYEHVKTDNRAVENQYPTLTLDEIKALNPPVAEDAVLFLWATSPKLAEAMEVLESWGFDYRTCMVWVKDKIGMGYYVRQQHELLLIAKRGEGLVPDEANRFPSVVTAPREAHSAKPDRFYELIEAMYPGFGYCELFARNERPGWVSWGNEVQVAA